jgi:hypothetical protein
MVHRSNQSDLTTCAPGMVWDTKRRKCVIRHSGVLPDSDLSEYAYALANPDRYQEAIDVLDLLDNPNTPARSTIAAMRPASWGARTKESATMLNRSRLIPSIRRCGSTLGKPMFSRASTTSQNSSWRRSRSSAVRTANITRTWPAR